MGAAALILWAAACGSAAAKEPPAEFRGLWVVRHSLTSPGRIHHVVETARRAGFNALLVQVRGRGDAYYRSRLVPRAEELPPNDPGFDPLAQVIREAHRAGLEVHAWVDVYLAWHPTDQAPRSPLHVLRRHPEWFMVSSDGIDMGRIDLDGVNLIQRGVEGRYLSPGIPEVRAHLLRVIGEIVRNYPVDGIHLDYIRYPNIHYDYNLLSRENFIRKYRFDPLALVDSTRTLPKGTDRARREWMTGVWEAWRADQVSQLVGAVHALIEKVRPGVKLSAAVKPDFRTAYRDYGQDWVRWINRGMVDFVVPMFYLGSTDEIANEVRDIRKYVKRGDLYAGIGMYNQSTSATVAQIDRMRQMGVHGVVLYSYDSLLKQPETYTRLRDDLFQMPSRVPRMVWKGTGEQP